MGLTNSFWNEFDIWHNIDARPRTRFEPSRGAAPAIGTSKPLELRLKRRRWPRTLTLGVQWDMAKDVTTLFRDASELSEDDRATLAGLLIESLEAQPEPDVEAAWSAEIERRVADIDSGNVKTIPWEDVRRRLLDRLNAR